MANSALATAHGAPASTILAGKVELATGAETNTGTDATRAVTPDGLDDWTGSTQLSVAVSNLANGTDGELITWGADAVATTVAAGTSGQVLTSNGAGAAPTFQAAPVTTGKAIAMAIVFG